MVLIGASGILLVSLSRATLEVMTRDEREGKLRVVPVIVQDRTIYKLPHTNMLPDNVFYIFKEIRDWLWKQFSFGGEKEVRTMIILADKRISEASALAEKGNFDLAFVTSMKAVDKLKYANGLVSELKNQDTSQALLQTHIKDATTAYSEIIREIGQKSGINNQKYILLQKNIDDFKEEQYKKEANTQN